MKVLLLFISVFGFIVQCNEKMNDPCFSDREVSEVIENQIVVANALGESWILKSENGTKRYAVCNGNQFELVQDSVYNVSGKCYEIKPNERWPGTPFEITSLKIQ